VVTQLVAARWGGLLASNWIWYVKTTVYCHHVSQVTLNWLLWCFWSNICLSGIRGLNRVDKLRQFYRTTEKTRRDPSKLDVVIGHGDSQRGMCDLCLHLLCL
jgi:hypothetical protein